MTDELKGREHLVARQVAMTNVFKKFQPIWGKTFHANAWGGLLESWMEECKGIDTAVLEPAAKALLKTQPKFPPKPWDFSAIARKLQYEQNPRSDRGADKTSEPYRQWQWLDPISHRIACVEMRGSEWVVMAVGEYVKFMAMDDYSKTAYCVAMENEHGLHAQRAVV